MGINTFKVEAMPTPEQPPLFSNRLAQEKSPYLLQHAHNPVDWYPWGEEAFRLAREQDKPVFLSIGYATCHWCHVMEQESFENADLAKLMNETFINIKVDREEKPEVDSLYMEFAQAMMSGSAGWPLNLILTPDLQPFFASTYLPPDSKKGFLGMKQLALRIGQIWKDTEEKENVLDQAGKIVDIFATHAPPEVHEISPKEQLKETAEILFKTADPIYGGTKGAPKFPVGVQACFLLRLAKANFDSRALFYVERSLEMMQRGGIYDHLGGGFARYSVDEKWMVPHFEKMLYDNAILIRAYLETWEYTRQAIYREVAEHILSYILRDMRNPNGGFFSAEDADTNGQEGLYYTWTWEEINQALGKDAPLFCEFYNVSPLGNFEGRNILYIKEGINEFAQHHHLDPVKLRALLKDLKAKLWKIRENRPHPLKDDKIISAWNGLMIYAYAEAGRAFNNPHYLKIAQEGAQFVKTHLWKNGVLHRRWREGEARYDGCLEDYAFMIMALLSLFEADKGSEWLEFALTLTHILKTDFKAEKGGFYLTNGKDPNLILRRCEFYDGAEPSGNAVHAENLLRLYQLTGLEEYQAQAEDILKAARGHIDIYPPGTCYHQIALQRYYDEKAPTLVVSLNEKEDHKEEISKMISAYFIPHKAVIWCREKDKELAEWVPLCRNKPPVEGKTTLYICYPDHCEEPLSDLAKMWETLEKL